MAISISDTIASLGSVGRLVDRNAEIRPSAIAVVCGNEAVTHSRLAHMAHSAASYLTDLGIRKGDRIGIFVATPSIDYFALSLGAMQIGAIAACINARFKTRELDHAVTNSGCRILVHDARLAEVVAQSCAPQQTSILDIDAIRDEWAQEGDNRFLEPSITLDPDTPARIIYTSGTTAMPKACLHTHGAMLHQAFSVSERIELAPEDRFWTPLPLFHTGGWTPFLASQAAGATLVHAGFFEPSSALRQIKDKKCTILFPSFETIWMQVLTHPDFKAEDLPDARLVLNVGVPERLEIMQNMLPHAPQVSNTGCTEVGGFLCIGKAEDSLTSRCETAGKLLSGMEAKIVDPDTGQEVPDDELGELLVRGPACLSEYYGDVDATRNAIDSEGWFRTGDLLRRSKDGDFSFVSRIKDMLKVGGENVAAAEIEGHLLGHSAVLIAAVVSVPDSYYGEVPAAFIQTMPGMPLSEQDIFDFCSGKIANFKIPKYVRFIEEWPMSGTKIRKVDLREIMLSSLEQPAG